MIRLECIGKHYDGMPAVKDLNLSIDQGRLAVLIGPSGCGKTTTLKMINRLIEPSSGRIFIGGQDTATLDPQALRRGIGYVIQSIGLFPHMTVQQNIGVVPSLLGWPKKKRVQRADELLELVGLDAERYRHSYPRQLSGGQAQRVGVARALAVDPPVLLMDEPFGAVDPLTRERLQDEFLKLQAHLRKTVVMVTHDIDEAIKMGDLVAVMNAGRLEQVAPPEEILANPANRFVRQFVGADRALKRLSRIQVSELMIEVPTVELGADRQEAARALAVRSTAYVTDHGRLVGWLDRKAFAHEPSVEDAYTSVAADQIGIAADDDVRDALSKMLGQGVSELPVLGPSGRPQGLLTLQAIVATTAGEPEETSEGAPGEAGS